MKYMCLGCGKKFLFMAKLVAVADLNEFVQYATEEKKTYEDTIESYVCPYCKSLNIDEYAEPVADVLSVKQVPIEEADTYLAQGYKIKEYYAKAVTIIKLAEVQK